MSNTSYQETFKKISGRLQTLHQNIPDVMNGFSVLHKAAIKDDVLDAKTRELIALAIGVAGHCEGCVIFHAQALAKMGASRKEVEEMLGVCILMGGGPSMMWATEALAAFDEFVATV